MTVNHQLFNQFYRARIWFKKHSEPTVFIAVCVCLLKVKPFQLVQFLWHRHIAAHIHWDTLRLTWITFISAHQTLLAGDFANNANKALSFSIDNVIAIGNEVIKMAIKVVILLPSSRIWPYVMPIFLHAQRQALWDSSLYLFKIKGLSDNKKHWQAALAYVGPIYWTMGKVRDWELPRSLLSPSHCQEGSPRETFFQFVWSKQQSHTRGKTAITRLVLWTDP